jgi:hypothetical protein
MTKHFEFNEWEAAFKTFYEDKEANPNKVLVVSIHPYSSGYWIQETKLIGGELDPKTDANCRVYETVEEVKAFEKRVTEAREKTKNLSLGGVIR